MANEIRIIRTDKEQPPLAVQILDALRNIINPAREDGNLASIKSKTDNLDVALSTRLAPTHLNIDAEKDLQVDIKSLPAVVQQSIRRILQYPEGTDIDPRQIRALTSSDVISVEQTDATKLKGTISQPDIKDAITASGSINAADNTDGLTVSINNDWRTLVQFRVTLGAAGTIILEASHDGTTYFELWRKTLTAAGSYCDWDLVGFPYFRVRVPTTGIDIAINCRAIKL
jgi:hypothetical protein